MGAEVIEIMEPAKASSHQQQNGHRSGRAEPSPYGGNFLLTPSLQEYLIPDLTLPEQYFGRHALDDGMGPERALMYAVLKDGIRCYYKNVGASRRKYQKLCAETEDWLLEDTWDYPFSFRMICDTLGINAECLRTRLLQWKEAELRRRELTGDTTSVQIGRSPFPTPVDLDRLEHEVAEGGPSHDDYDDDFETGDDDWPEPEHMSLDDLANAEEFGRAA